MTNHRRPITDRLLQKASHVAHGIARPLLWASERLDDAAYRAWKRQQQRDSQRGA